MLIVSFRASFIAAQCMMQAHSLATLSLLLSWSFLS